MRNLVLEYIWIIQGTERERGGESGRGEYKQDSVYAGPCHRWRDVGFYFKHDYGMSLEDWVANWECQDLVNI